MVSRKAEEKREKQLGAHKESLREINDSLRRKNMCLIGIAKEAERGPQCIFEQIIAENFPNLRRETGIQIQDIERTPPKFNKNHSIPRHLIVKLANSKDKENFF